MERDIEMARKSGNKIPRGYFSERGIDEELICELYLKLDVLLAKIICSKRQMNEALSDYWRDFFPDLAEGGTAYECAKGFYKAFRKTAMDIIKGVEVSAETYPYYSNLQRMVVRYTLLLHFDKESFTAAEEEEKIFELVKGVIPSGRLFVNQEVELDLATYFGEKREYRLSEAAQELLRKEKRSIQDLHDRLLQIVASKEGRMFSDNIFVSKFNSVRLEGLLEECFLDFRQNEESYLGHSDKFERLLEKHWPQAYPNLAFTEKSQKMVYHAIKEDKLLNAVRTLIIAGNVKDIRSPQIARCLAYGYTLKYVMVSLRSCRDMDAICEEVSEMAARINFVGVDQDEENDIIAFLARRYCTVQGVVDEEILNCLLERKEKIVKVYHMIRDAFNSRFTSKSLEEKDKIISELQQRVECEDTNTLKRAVRYLGDKDFGYILNDLFRICHGYDSFDERKVKDSLNGLFYILGLLGIEAEEADKVGEVFSDADELNEQCQYDDDMEKSDGRYVVRYPGWKVMGERVLAPISMNFSSEGDI